MNKKWLVESELALKAVSTSAEMIEEKAVENMAFKIKGSPRDIVTSLDLLIEGHIKKILEPSGYRIIGEETAKNGDFVADLREPTWFIDPIDGTTNLVTSLPFYAISVGLVVDSTFSAGAVAMPHLKEIFFSMGNLGAFMNGKVLKVHHADMKNSIIAAAFSASCDDITKRKKEYEIFGILNDKSRGCLRLGAAAINICYVAANHVQVAYGISNKIWDVAGALAVALQAGGCAYIARAKETADISYVVGSSQAVEDIVELFRQKGIADMIAVVQNA